MGQKIVIFIIVLLIGLMVFMMMSQTSTKSQKKETIKTENNNTQNIDNKQKIMKKDAGLIEDSELKIVKDLQTKISSSEAKSSKMYLVSCAPCHGKDGKGIIAPPINGQSKEYILEKLRAYKNNEIPNSLMKGIFTNVDEKTLEGLAVEISKFPK